MSPFHSTLRMGYLLPSITRKIDELLLVKQLNAKLLDHCVKDDLLAIATSSPLAGNNYDYERLELLGARYHLSD
jgi:endoribonuclease Dicer